MILITGTALHTKKPDPIYTQNIQITKLPSSPCAAIVQARGYRTALHMQAPNSRARLAAAAFPPADPQSGC